MIRVLHSVSNMDRGGIETMLMNYYRHIDREKVQFDFIVNKQKPGDYDDEIRRLGGHIYQSPGLNPLHYPAYLRFVQQTVATDPRIRILHAHNEAMGLYALKGAEKAGLQVRIAHAHNIWIVRDYKWPLKMFCKQLLPGAATHLWACGRDAGIYYFGKADWERRGQIIPNAIEPETFRFSPAVRAEMRARYGLEDRVVLGHVGRFDVRKNHERLLEIFAAFLQLEPRAMLVLIGTGRLEQAVRAQAQELGITDHILFAGLQSNVADWYQMMDLFVIPTSSTPAVTSLSCPPALRVCRWWGSRRKPLGWGAYFRTQCRRRCCFLPMPSRSRFPPAMQTGQQACSGCSTSPATDLLVQN